MWDIMNKINGQHGRGSMATWNSLARAQEEEVGGGCPDVAADGSS